MTKAGYLIAQKHKASLNAAWYMEVRSPNRRAVAASSRSVAALLREGLLVLTIGLRAADHPAPGGKVATRQFNLPCAARLQQRFSSAPFGNYTKSAMETRIPMPNQLSERILIRNHLLQIATNRVTCPARSRTQHMPHRLLLQLTCPVDMTTPWWYQHNTCFMETPNKAPGKLSSA